MKGEEINPSKVQVPKGQIKPKADWCAINSPKKEPTKLFFFCHGSLEILEI
jgi:hypothetical protein